MFSIQCGFRNKGTKVIDRYLWIDTPVCTFCYNKNHSFTLLKREIKKIWLTDAIKVQKNLSDKTTSAYRKMKEFQSCTYITKQTTM